MAKSIYSFLKVMKDKLYQKTINYSNNEWESVKRIEKTHLSMIDNLYYITDSPTFIRDNIYLGSPSHKRVELPLRSDGDGSCNRKTLLQEILLDHRV